MRDLRLSGFTSAVAWGMFFTILLGIVFREVSSDLISWLGLAIAFIVAIGAGVTGAILDGARRKRGGQ